VTAITAQTAIESIKRTIEKTDQEKRAIDPRWSAQARREREAELAAALKGQVEKERDQGLQALEEARKAARAKRHKALLAAGPSSPAEWQEAAARAGFVAQDLLGMAPEEIPLSYEAAREAKDTVGAWLLFRLGQQHLGAVLETKADNKPAAKALQDLESMNPTEAAEKEYKAELRTLGDLQAELWRAFSHGVPGDPFVDRGWRF
jgi:hypothetical protein